jgi:hypothetical protein
MDHNQDPDSHQNVMDSQQAVFWISYIPPPQYSQHTQPLRTVVYSEKLANYLTTTGNY